MRRLILLCIVVIGVAGCAGDGSPPTDDTPGNARFEQMQLIFDRNCLGGGCHNTVNQAAGLVLERGVSFGELIEVEPTTPAALNRGLLRVTPFEPEQSFLYVKITEPGPADGGRMPLNAAPLAPSEITLIRDWIAAGANPPPSGSPNPTNTSIPSPTVAATDSPTATQTPTLVPATATPPPPVTITASVSATVAQSSPTVAQSSPTPSMSPTPTASPSPEATVSLAEIQTTIFTPICATQFCHSAATRLGNLSLQDGQSFDSLVNVTPENLAARNEGLLRVRPGDPDGSFLVIKLENPTVAQGARMPFLLPPLEPEQIELIRRWIAQGADP